MTCVILSVLGGCQVVFPLGPEAACPVAATPSCGVTDPDEDGDDLRDDCDPCPQLGASTLDTDLDGIGDLCDPQPTMKARCLSRRFFGFDREDGWLDPTGWSFDGDAFNEDSDRTSDTLITLLSNDVFPTGRAELVIRDGAINGEPPGSITGVVSMVLMGTGYFCGYQQESRTALLARLHPDGEEVLRTGEVPLDVTPGVTHQVLFTIRPDGRLVCRLSIYDRDTHTVSEVQDELTFDDPTPSTSGSVGLAMRSSTAAFDYLDFVAD